LSDALHALLTQRFVDRRTSVLMRRLKQKESLVAEVNDKGEVTVEGEFVGRLEGFRFRQDASNSPDEARIVRQAAVQALRPEFHLRADKFYNSPDTEMDFTEQGGLMWGNQAVGKLVAGAEALRPSVEAFVDEDAGPDVAEKVRRRLQHFIDRKVAAQFEPLLAMSRDEGLTGLARGFAFRLVEGLGLLPRDAVTEEVKTLDQEARSALRKHGVRFGQFTIFLPLLLKPAPTRLRLVLWSLANGLQEFPESPPPGLVTIPNIPDVPKQHYTLAGYHPAGTRAIRIDMLERLADLLRAKDSRAGFEAAPEMLSITGMTLEQFADLMGGLGYKGEKAERPKVKPETVVTPAAVPEPTVGETVETAEVVAPVEDAADRTPAEDAADETPPEAVPEIPVEAAPVEMESYYTFVWAPRPRGGDARGPRNRNERGGDRGPREGQSREGQSHEGQPREGKAREGKPREGQPREGQPREGQPREGKPREGQPREGQPREGKPQGEGHNRGNRGDRPKGDRLAADTTVAAPAADAPARPDRGPRPERNEGYKGKPKGKGGDRGGKDDRGNKERGDRSNQPKTFEARPPRTDKIDPDNPFAVLASLRNRT